MANDPALSCTPKNLEYLDLEQAAMICSVSDERFAKWIEKGIIPVIQNQGKKLIHSHDLIQHLIRHNIPIPDRLLQGSNKKVLFVLTNEEIPQNIATEFIWTLFRLRKQSGFIFDFVRYDNNVELKIITLCPDIIVLLQDALDREVENSIRKMTNDATPVYTFVTDQKIDLTALCTD